jgi:aminopeptidase-like protein
LKIGEFDSIQKDSSVIGKEMYSLMKELFPICRSITGNGVRETLKIISKQIPLTVHEVSSGTKVFDWVIPKEWNIEDAYVLDSNKNKIIDFKKSNLHVLNYSIPINKKITLSELKEHIHTLPEQPDAIPYLTSYYKEEWGFCMTHNDFLKLSDDEYDVVINSSLEHGSLTYGEYFIEGQIKDEFVLTCYVCHPSLCNDNLSGTVLITSIAKSLANIKPYYSYRFLFIPETIGAITWLAKNESNLIKIKHGLVATCVGDPGPKTYKKSRRGNAEIDKAAENILKSSKENTIRDFWPSGSDERQFCSPGFNLPFGSLIRSVYGYFPEYHTSLDDLTFVQEEFLIDSFSSYISIIFIIENNRKYLNLNPKCEPQLGKRGLYRLIGGQKNGGIDEIALFWVLNQSDGNTSLLDISEKSNLQFKIIKDAADALYENNLLKLL